MNANEITFGIEIETTLPGNDDTPIGAYHNGLQVPWLPQGWKAERDSSIRTMAANRKGCEFVSPKLKGQAGLEQVMTAVAAIKDRGARVNETCGIHITIGFDGDAAALARLISLVGNHEKAIFASTGTRRREQNIFSKTIKPYGCHKDAKRRCEADRYHGLNLTHLARGRNRVEFRFFAASLNQTKIAGYIMMCLGLAELALEPMRCPGWTYTKRPGTKSLFERDGEGESELVRLFYRLAWTRGWYKGARRNNCYGMIAGPNTPALAEIKKKLVDLARQYDRRH